MTLSEFKAWFEGFTEDLSGAPSAKQWTKIKAKVKAIDGTVTSYPVFIDWAKPYRRYWERDWIAYGGGYVQKTTADMKNIHDLYASNATLCDKRDNITLAFDATAAMHNLGKAEALA